MPARVSWPRSRYTLARDTPNSSINYSGVITGRSRANRPRMRNMRLVPGMMRSTSRNGRTPAIERALLMGPFADGTARFAVLDLRRNLDQIAIGVAHHEEHIVARPMAPQTPDDRLAQPRHMVAPGLHASPVGHLERQVVETGHRRQKQRQRMVQRVAAQKAGAQT